MSKELRATPVARPTIPVPLRVLGECVPTAEIVIEAAEQNWPISISQPVGVQDGQMPIDEAAIDPALHIAQEATEPPPLGVGYAGMSAPQRHAFLQWASEPTMPTAPAYQQLYIANLEPYLLESASARATMARHLVTLSLTPAWSGNLWLSRAILLAFWLDQAGAPLANWLDQGHCSPALLGVALGLQALLEVPMQPGTLATILAVWNIGADQPIELLKLRLASLTTVLGREPLALALENLGEDQTTPQPWRSANRLLRPTVPQPDLRRTLEPLLRDLPDAQDEDVAALLQTDAEQFFDDDGSNTDPGWQLILEFGQSRSDYFDMALRLAQKQSGYSQLMDENRKMVYRITFRKRDMRRFWRLWEFVQGWADTRVYLNGDELEKWKVWPYSQYLR